MSSTRSTTKAPLAGAFFLAGSQRRLGGCGCAARRCEPGRHPAGHRLRCAGFSLIELVAVLVILAVLGAMAVPRMNQTSLAERGYAEQVAEVLRFSRTKAVASGCDVRFTINQDGFAVAQRPINGTHCDTVGAAWPTPVLRADGSDLSGTPPTGVATTGLPAAPGVVQVIFDSRGFVAAVPVPFAIGGQQVAVFPSGMVVGP